MRKNICIIDDSLPVVDYSEFINSTKLIDESALKFLCSQHSEWPEEPLKGLINEIISSHANWGINAFHTPTFYFNHIEEEIYSPEIIIFDWDYAGESEATDIHLYRVLSTSYSVVGIFTGADRKDEIEKIITNDPFKKYSDRIHLVEKGEENAITKIIDQVNEKFESHFSFKLGQELKYNSIKALDSILVSISNLSFDDFVNTFGHESENKKYITINEFIEILTEKYKNNLNDQVFSQHKFEIVNNQAAIPGEVLRELWWYRMFYNPKDDIVRTGDIIQLKGAEENVRFLVISSDCHLNLFWNKNLGSITLIPLQKIEKGSTNLIDKLKINGKGKTDKFKNEIPTSIATKWIIDSLTIVPNIKEFESDGKNSTFFDYAIFPREVFSINVRIPKGQEANSHKLGLTYSFFNECINHESRLNINEPFRTPLIQFIVNNITGYGAPDYPKALKDVIKNNLNEQI